jgi:endonuclease YncB( thermonuclease family)
MNLIKLVVLAAWTSFGSHRGTPELEGKVVRVHAGDSITVASPEARGGRARVRLWGIRCPAPSEPLGSRARRLTQKSALGKFVHVTYIGEGGEVTVKRKQGWSNLNGALVESGLARRHNDRGRYEREEKRARSAVRGIWGHTVHKRKEKK